MNTISIKMGDMEINCEATAFPAVFQALREANPAKIDIGVVKAQEKAAPARENVTELAPVTEPPEASPAESSSKLIKLMDKWNRQHSKEVSVRGRRFSDADKKLLYRIACAARDESASITWVAHTCRVCSATIHRALTWNEGQ